MGTEWETKVMASVMITPRKAGIVTYRMQYTL